LALVLKRARIFLAGGVTALEIKSGYGLEAEHELKMLRVIRRLAEQTPQRLVPTLLAHVVPQGWRREDYLAMFTRELIPEATRQGLAEAVDVFCDRDAFTLAETRRILEAALERGLKIKAHAEQLSRTGAARLVAELGGLSADHLEVAAPEDWAALARAGTVGTVLPGAALILRKPFPDARAMWDMGVKVALATDHNPGSSPLYSLLLALQLGVALGGLTVEEALLAGTAHAADALQKEAWGRLRAGSPADFLVVDAPEALQPLYSWGHAPLHGVYVGGALVAGSAARSTEHHV
jgi:imidazolonepropionase